MIQSSFNSLKPIASNLIWKIESIGIGKTIKEAGTGKDIKITDSKVITKERKTVKESLYNIVDSKFSDLDKEIHAVTSQNKDIVIKKEDLEILISEFKSEITIIFEAFIIEKKLAPSLAKYATIALSGMLIKKLNDSK